MKIPRFAGDFRRLCDCPQAPQNILEVSIYTPFFIPGFYTIKTSNMTKSPCSLLSQISVKLQYKSIVSVSCNTIHIVQEGWLEWKTMFFCVQSLCNTLHGNEIKKNSMNNTKLHLSGHWQRVSFFFLFSLFKSCLFTLQG